MLSSAPSVPRRALRTSVATLTVGLVLVGCSGEEPLPEADLQQALLTADVLGTGWVERPEPEQPDDPDDPDGTDDESDGTEESPSPRGTGAGCLDSADQLEAVEPVDTVGASFAWTGGAGSGSLSLAQGVGTYDDPDAVATEFDAAFEELEDCTEVTNQTGGATMRAQISTDREVTSDLVDSQLNVEAAGRYSSGEQSQEFTIRITLAQVGAQVTTVQTVGTGDTAAAHASYVEIAVDRLAALVDGEEPPETVAPTPTLR